MRYSLLLSASALVLMAFPVNAEDYSIPGEFSGNVGFVSDYVFRGITQSDENPALQGGFDYEHDMGVYLGVWGSSVDFNDNSEASFEVDFYGGYRGEVDGFSYDLGAIYYVYPGADSALDYDYYELMASLGYDFEVASAGASVNYSRNILEIVEMQHMYVDMLMCRYIKNCL